MVSRCLRLLSCNIQHIINAAPRTLSVIQRESNLNYAYNQLATDRYVFKKLCHSSVPAGDASTAVGKVEVKINLMYTCKICKVHNSHIISRLSYEKGVVIVTCNGCNNKHLIADNLNWFEDIKEKNIEQMLAKKGEVVLKVKAVPEAQREYSEQ